MKSIQRLAALQKTRIVAFGSSNTECCYPHTFVPSWLNWVDYGLRHIFGRTFTTINSGIGGQIISQLVSRFDDDVALYQPHLVFITIGGNDSNPQSGISCSQFKAHLDTLIDGCQKIPNCDVVLQTYYSPIFEEFPYARVEKFTELMETICQTAVERKLCLFDHFTQWRHLKTQMGTEYKKVLMDDPLHLNALGNQLWAYNILNRLVGSEIAKIEKYFQPVRQYQKILAEVG